jgi:hypothetical protein
VCRGEGSEAGSLAARLAAPDPSNNKVPAVIVGVVIKAENAMTSSASA